VGVLYRRLARRIPTHADNRHGCPGILHSVRAGCSATLRGVQEKIMKGREIYEMVLALCAGWFLGSAITENDPIFMVIELSVVVFCIRAWWNSINEKG